MGIPWYKGHSTHEPEQATLVMTDTNKVKVCLHTTRSQENHQQSHGSYRSAQEQDTNSNVHRERKHEHLRVKYEIVLQVHSKQHNTINVTDLCTGFHNYCKARKMF